MARIKVTDSEIVTKWLQLKSSADSRNIHFDLSLRKVKVLLQSEKCFYTAIKFVKNDQLLCRSVDRIDSSIGYIDSNVVVCTAQINSFKDKVDLPLMIRLVKKLGKLVKLNPQLKTGTRSRPKKVTI